MKFQSFLDFVSNPYSGFNCCIGASKTSNRRFIARVSHALREPASETHLRKLKSLIPDCPSELIEFYSMHDGATLFMDSISEVIDILPIAKMSSETTIFRKRYKSVLGMCFEDDAKEMQKNNLVQYSTAVVIAACRGSSSYFVMPTQGIYAQKICLFIFEEWKENPLVGTFTEFLSYITTEPVTLLNTVLGSHTRFSDGRTPVQWYPIQYISDVREP